MGRVHLMNLWWVVLALSVTASAFALMPQPAAIRGHHCGSGGRPSVVSDQLAELRRPAGWRELVAALRQRLKGGGSTAGQRRRESAALLRQFSALLQSGRSEIQAWADVHRHWRNRSTTHPFTVVCAQAHAAERSGTGASEGLLRCAKETTDPEIRSMLHRLVAAVRLSAETGAPLSKLVDTMAEGIDDSARLYAAVETSAAGPKLTQLILTLLPAGGVMLGQLMGSSPVQALLGSTLGWSCLGLGLMLLMAGRLWSQRMLSAVTQQVR